MLEGLILKSGISPQRYAKITARAQAFRLIHMTESDDGAELRLMVDRIGNSIEAQKVEGCREKSGTLCHLLGTAIRHFSIDLTSNAGTGSQVRCTRIGMTAGRNSAREEDAKHPIAFFA